MDQCTHCIVRGDLKRCFETPCTQHEAWMVGELIKAIHSVENLIEESYGVSGLHLNGDVAPWEDIFAGGRFEEWLADFDVVVAALRKARGETAGAITDSMTRASDTALIERLEEYHKNLWERAAELTREGYGDMQHTKLIRANVLSEEAGEIQQIIDEARRQT